MTSILQNLPNYDEDVDFQALALKDVEFAKFYHESNGRIDFQDPKALQQLTKSLLKCDFDLDIELPDDRLCPPVPVRYNYIRWIQGLLDTTNDAELQDPQNQSVTGLDIGIGASCIYSLLACSTRPSWTMLGTDIDSKSFSYAIRNIENNGMSSRIHTRLTTSDAALIPLEALGKDSIDFTMCNPPFYSSLEDMQASNAAKAAPPSAICTGAEVEMICPGGDAGFVLRMVEESRELGTKVRWYTSMLGKLSSVHQIIDHLKEIGVSNWAVTLLRAGKRTKRWAVAWSFGDRRPRNDIARGSDIGNHILPLPTAQTIHIIDKTRQDAANTLNITIEALDLHWKWQPESWTGSGTASENVWSRSARRKRKRIEMEHDNDHKPVLQSQSVDDQEQQQSGVALRIRIEVREGDMEVQWLQGKDHVLFESFCGMLKRKMTSGK